MNVGSLAQRFRDAVDAAGIILVHDAALPSLTTLAAGEPIQGSWWSHPLANPIYNALGAIEDDVLRVKLIRNKDTLVSKRLWPAVVGVASERAAWQTKARSAEALDLLATIDAEQTMVFVDAEQREFAKQLVQKLLVHSADVHTTSGKHVTRFESWRSWSETHAVKPLPPIDAKTLIETRIEPWNVSKPKLLPW